MYKRQEERRTPNPFTTYYIVQVSIASKQEGRVFYSVLLVSRIQPTKLRTNIILGGTAYYVSINFYQVTFQHSLKRFLYVLFSKNLPLKFMTAFIYRIKLILIMIVRITERIIVFSLLLHFFFSNKAIIKGEMFPLHATTYRTQNRVSFKYMDC